jgi:hypothetical protein
MKNRKLVLLSSCFIIVVFAFLLVQGCSHGQGSNPTFQTEYQAVLLTNGQVYFGKTEFVSKEYVLLKDVFYIRRQINPETKQVSNTLLKKGSEWHGAEQTYINTRHVILIEPVAPESQVAKLIKDANSQKAETPKK